MENQEKYFTICKFLVECTFILVSLRFIYWDSSSASNALVTNNLSITNNPEVCISLIATSYIAASRKVHIASMILDFVIF